MQGRNVDMFKLSAMQGSKFSSLGYKSIGERVPDVMITLLNRLKIGAMASEESRHES